MDFEYAAKLLNACDVIESQEVLMQFKASDWPYLKKQDREKQHRELHKKAYPHEWSGAKPLTVEEAAKKLAGLNFPKGALKRGQ